MPAKPHLPSENFGSNQEKESLSISEAIILAGGFGTRLREAVPDLPKCMAPVAGRPFLSYVIDHLRRQGVRRFIFSLGYKAEMVEEYLTSDYPTLTYISVIEDEPLGTGGAIQLCLKEVEGENVVIANGDTLFAINLPEMMALHQNSGAACTLALKPMQQFDRYGAVSISETGEVEQFREKQFYKEGLINGGVYLLHKTRFLQEGLPQKFSFEKEYLEPNASKGTLYGAVQEGYFIDIGIPEDYQKAQRDLQKSPLDLKQIDTSWTLFLDRDGVINEERVGQYVLHWGEFVFCEGALEAIGLLSQKFGRIFIVTNQRGVGRGLMTLEDLHHIHKEMQNEVEAAGGRIDGIYFCTEKEATCFDRKPNPGMALQVRRDFPEIDLSKAVMVGNKPSDARFGRAAGMYTVFVTTTNPDQPFPHPDIDLCYPTLLDFARSLQS